MPWSTMTITESKPWDLGRPVMRSTEMEEKGRGFLTARGDRPGTVGCVFTLAAWQLVQPEMKQHRNIDIPGHQYSHCIWWRVQKKPSCPLAGDSWRDFTKSCHVSSGM